MFSLTSNKIYHSVPKDNGSLPRGSVWAPIAVQPGSGQHIEKLYYWNNILYAQVDDKSNIWYYSSDKGVSWQTLPTDGLFDHYIYDLFRFSKGIASLTPEGIFTLEDGTTSWTRRMDGIEYSAGITYKVGNILFYFSMSDFFRSDDNGKTWSKINFGPGNENLLIDELPIATDNKIYVMGYDDSKLILLASEDGINWEDTGKPVGSNTIFLGTSNNTLFIYNYSSFAPDEYYSTSDGKTWERLDNITPFMKPYSYKDDKTLIGNGNIVLMKADIGDIIYSSSDNGSTWNSFSQGLYLDNRRFVLQCASDEYYYLTTFDPDYQSTISETIYRRGVLENKWEKALGSGLPERIDVFRLVEHKGILYLATWDGQIFKSTDRGDHWTSLRGNIPPEVGVISFTFNGNSLFIGTWGHAVWRTDLKATPQISSVPEFSIEKGENLSIQLEVLSGNVGQWTVLNQIGIISTTGLFNFVGKEEGLFISKVQAMDIDGLTDTVEIKIKVEGLEPPKIVSIGNQKIFLGDTLNLLLSLEKGNIYKWILLKGDGKIDGSTFSFIGKNAGTFEIEIKVEDVNGLSDSLAFDLFVEEVNATEKPLWMNSLLIFPNPVYESSIIKFDLQKPQLINLYLMDVNGKRVRNLVSGKRASGTHAITLERGSLSSSQSILFLVLETETYTQIKKVVIN